MDRTPDLRFFSLVAVALPGALGVTLRQGPTALTVVMDDNLDHE